MFLAAVMTLAGELGSLGAYALVAGTVGVFSVRLPERHSKAIGIAAFVFVFAHAVRAFVGPSAYENVLAIGYIFIAYATYQIFRSSSRRLELSVALEAGAIGSALATVLAFNPYFEIPSARLLIVAIATGGVLFILMSNLGRETVPIIKMYLLAIVVANWMEALADLFPEPLFSALWTAPYYPLVAGLLLPPHLRQLSQSHVPARRRFGLPQLALYGTITITSAVTAYLNDAMPLGWAALAAVTTALIFARFSLLVTQRDWSFGQEQRLRRYGADLISITTSEAIDNTTLRCLRNLSNSPDRVAIIEVSETGEYHVVADNRGQRRSTAGRFLRRRRPMRLGGTDVERTLSWFSDETRSLLAVKVPPTTKNQLPRYFVCESSNVLLPETEDHYRSAAGQYSLALKNLELTAQIQEQTARLAMEKARTEAHEAWQALSVGSHEVAIRIHEGLVTATTPQPELILGFSPLNHSKEELEFLSEEYLDGSSFQNPQQEGQWLKVTQQVAPDGSQVFTIRQVTDEVTDAATDSVTGFPLVSKLEELDYLTGAAVYLFEFQSLDRLRERNGRAAGDQALQILARRMSDLFRSREDNFWRGEGNRILVATSDTLADEHLEQRLSTVGGVIITEAFEHEPSIAIAAVDLDRSLNTSAAVLQRLQIALNHGQENGLQVARFSEDLYMKVRRKWSLERSIKRSIEDPAHGGFTVHYQPLVSTKPDAPVVAVEALARWIHPELGAISPGEFIPIAEDLGMIDAIDNFVFNQALRDIDLFREVVPDLLVHVNMSPMGSLAEKLESILTTVAVHGRGKARSLVVEVTESALGQQPRQELLEATQQLRDTGIGLAVDDFGTGESNFDRVAELPFSEVKLARTFVDADHVMLDGLVHSFHSLGLTVVAENIEELEQLERMRDAGCDVIQGYFYSRPAEVETIIGWMRDRLSPDQEPALQQAPQEPIG